MTQLLPSLHKTWAPSPALALEGGVFQKSSVGLKQQALDKVSLRILKTGLRIAFTFLKNHKRKQTRDRETI